MRILALAVRGFRGHPLHPPLTDVSIGAYTVATIAVVVGWTGWEEPVMADAGFVAMVVGLVAAVPTSATGLADFLGIPRDVGARRTAWVHLTIMLAATMLFLVAAILLHEGFLGDHVPAAAAITTIVAFLVLTLGGWVGGTMVYVQGLRVVGDEDASVGEAIRPSGPRDEPSATKVRRR